MQVDYSDSFHLTSDEWHELVMIEGSFTSLAKIGIHNNLTDFESFLSIHEQLSKRFQLFMERVEVNQSPSASIEPD